MEDKTKLDLRKFTDEKRCSYRCPYYCDGSAYSWCRLYGKALRYDDIPPLRDPKCLED